MSYKQRISKKSTPYSKTDNLKKNVMSTTASPVYIPSHEDYINFKETCKYYGVSSNEDSTHKLEEREKKELFIEVSISLNPSYTKIVRLGLDVYNGFRPCLKIVKTGFNSGVYFTIPQFKELLNVIDDMIENLRHTEEGKYELEEYTVHTTELNAVKFVPKKNGEKFQLYLGASSLKELRRMKVYFTTQLNYLENCDCYFLDFVKDVVDKVDDKKKEEVSYEDFIDVLGRKYSNNAMLYEVVHKFPHFMNRTIKEYMETHDDRFLFK